MARSRGDVIRMSWSATVRYGMEPAPEGLGFAQDLMNTISAGKPRTGDLLADPDEARTWLAQALAQWSRSTGAPAAGFELDPDGHEDLRAFRDDLRRAAEHGGTDALPSLHTAAVALQLGGNGQVHLEPRGTGWRRVAALALIEVFQAQRAGTWERLKICRNERCGVAFFDRSRNNSGVWHDVKVCGNAANLRAYRARQRARSAT
ncbi:CGNR zinc finger domain-containing protein [Streptomyces sp. NPDC101151]|uniref:CGNR zinc finger domain-containing protein n=1 Tax=Streptomyces sp. NPDC101151 TaxID=3366115 RepID=UPI00382CD648